MPKWSDLVGVKSKSLGDGQLANSKGTLYTCPTTEPVTRAVVSKITLVNTSSSAVVVNLYFKASGGTSRRIISKNLSLAGGFLLLMDTEQTLEQGDIIEGDAGSGTTVDYTISGGEKV